MSTWENFRSFSLNRKSFPVNHGLVDLKYTVSLQKCYNESFTASNHFVFKTQSFPLQMFSDIWYSLEQRNTMVSPSLHPLGDLNIMAY